MEELFAKAMESQQVAEKCAEHMKCKCGARLRLDMVMQAVMNDQDCFYYACENHPHCQELTKVAISF